MDGIYLKRNWGGEFENVFILVALAVDEDGYQEVIGAAEGSKEDRRGGLASCVALRNAAWLEPSFSSVTAVSAW